jgi:predicted dehydrogenase
MENNRLRIGLIGLGHLGKIHLKCLTGIKEVDLIGLFDTDTELAKSIGAANKLSVFEDLDQMFDEVDAVDIVAPTTAHFEIARRAILAGKHVFIEKPLVSTIEEGKALEALTLDMDIKVQVGHVERFNPAYLAVRDMNLNPLFVEAHRLSEFNPRGTDVPVVLDLMIHDLDILLQLVKSKIKSISASGVSVVSDTPDISNVRLEFENGCVANITASRMALKKMRKMRLFQKDAYISLDFLEKQAQVIRLENINENDNEDGFMEIQTNSGRKKLIMEMPTSPEVNAIQEELRNFALSVLDNKEVVVPLRDGLRALELAHLIIDQIEAQNKVIQNNW